MRRIYGILENQSLERMMAQTESKLDLFTEINKTNVILINTSVDFLQKKGTELFGRFFIAMILNATQQRATMGKSKHPVFVYIDEFGDYAAHVDDKITTIFGQARKQDVGMIVAHQRFDDLSPKTLSALDANTSIKFAGGVAYQDLRSLAGMLRTDQSFIEEQKKGSFAAYIKADDVLKVRVHGGMRAHLAAGQQPFRNKFRPRNIQFSFRPGCHPRWAHSWLSRDLVSRRKIVFAVRGSHHAAS